MSSLHDNNDDETCCVYDTFDLDEQRAILEKFESSRIEDDADGIDAETTYPLTARSDVVSMREEIDSSSLLGDLDDDFVREQQKILDDIQRSTSSLPSTSMTELEASTSASSTLTESTACSLSSLHSLEDSKPTASLGMSRRRLDILESMMEQEGDSGLLHYYGVSNTDAPESSSRRATSEPQQPFTPQSFQRKIPKHPKSETLGKLMVRCAGECSRKYLVSTKCKVLLCPRCETLTPTSLGIVE
eukprot:CAMPEP_0197451536 /NCGR_PEP_ID=MMETSP1175-20131217/29269_1 /TAXON_ID=1003142 /ORGANISM="Triceratium dubium, Strain CCMP147" /LENGTH=244 /DNA_ID=CAMNT_0042984279 /DNA_START=70 /DNA_END=804 /DNA_ORIENTATION=+